VRNVIRLCRMYRVLQKVTSSAYIFNTPELILMIFGTLQRHFILNISVDSSFIKYIVQSVAFCALTLLVYLLA